MPNVNFNEEKTSYAGWAGDEVIVHTNGSVTFRMWDVRTCAPENPRKEALKRMFGCSKRAPETAIDWDFLLED